MKKQKKKFSAGLQSMLISKNWQLSMFSRIRSKE